MLFLNDVFESDGYDFYATDGDPPEIIFPPAMA